MVPRADRAPSLRPAAAIRRALAGLLVALLAALTPLLSAAPAGAARTSGRSISAPASTATAHTTSSGQHPRRAVSLVRHRSSGNAVRRVMEEVRALRPAHPQRGGTAHQPTSPASGSIDATGPPSTYADTTVSSSQQRLGACHHPAAAGRAPPSSCGS